MCTRYVFTDPAEAIRDRFSITAPLPNWPPSYNVAPTHILPVIRAIDSGREIAMMEWRRCIVPATSYIEFTGQKGDKTAHLFTRTDGKPIALAGLWDRRVSRDKAERKETYTVVTTAPSTFAAQFHDRMPCVLELEDVDAWLRSSPDESAGLMRPAADVLQERPLGRAINNVKNNVPELLA
jgi:putative SOS response-associated peptidase YedK